MYFTDEEIDEILKKQEMRLRKANVKKGDKIEDLGGLQRWLRKNQIETPEALEVAVKKKAMELS